MNSILEILILFPLLAGGMFLITAPRAWLYVAIAYACLPLRFWTDLAFRLPGLGEMNLDTTLALVMIVAMGLRYLYLYHHEWDEPAFAVTRLWLYFGLFLMVMVSGGAMVLSGSPTAAKVMIRWIYPFVFLLLLSRDQSCTSAEGLEKVQRFFMGLGIVISIGLVGAYGAGIELWRGSAYGVTRFVGLGSISDHAYLMGVLSVIAYARFRLTEHKTLHLLLFGLFFLNIMLTLTRGAVFSTVLGVLAIEFFGLRAKMTTKMIMVGVLVVTGISAVTFYQPLRERVFAEQYRQKTYYSHKGVAGKLGESFARSGRLASYDFALRNISGVNLLYGVGLGTTQDLGFEELGTLPHNEYIQLFLDVGLIGLTLFLGMIWQFGRICFSGARNLHLQISRLSAAAAMGVIVVFAFGAVVDNMFSKYKMMPPFLLLFVGTLLAAQRIEFQRQTVQANQGSPARTEEVPGY